MGYTLLSNFKSLTYKNNKLRVKLLHKITLNTANIIKLVEFEHLTFIVQLTLQI